MTPEEFDEAYPTFQMAEYLVDMPNEIPQPFFDEAARRVYEFRLYNVAAGREATTEPMRNWASKGWSAIEQCEEADFAKAISSEIRSYVSTNEPGIVGDLLDVLLWVPFRFCECPNLKELRKDLIMTKLDVRNGILGEVEELLTSVEDFFS